MNVRRTSARLTAAAGVLGALDLIAALSAATQASTSSPTTIVLTPPRSTRSVASADPTHSGVSSNALPDRPVLLWRKAAPGAFDRTSLGVDARGAITAAPARAPFLVQWSASGDETQRLRIGLAPATSGVVVLNDGTRVVVDAFGTACGFAPSGATRFRAPLELLDRHARITLVPAEDGGVLVGAGSEVIWVDADGAIASRIRLREIALSAPVLTQRGWVVGARGGTLYLLARGGAQALGSLHGDASEAGFTTLDGMTIYAVVESRAVVAYDLSQRRVQAKLTVGDQSLHGPVAFLPNGVLAVMTFAGELVRIAANGQELPRLALEERPPQLVVDGGQVNFAALDESPRFISDEGGRLAFARVGGAIGVVSPEGRVERAAGGACASPAALASAGPHRFAVACRDGDVLMFGDRTP